jgi:DNA topoisomerase-3
VNATANKRGTRKTRDAANETSVAKTAQNAASAEPRKIRTPKAADTGIHAETVAANRSQTPTERMLSYAQKLARMKGIALPPDCDRDFQACRRFLDEHG